jgi:hypothetical protein
MGEKMKVKYIETAPLKRELIFANSSEFWKFYSEYHDKMFKKYCEKTYFELGFAPLKENWKYEQFKITKKGIRGKPHDATQLRTPKAIAKQKVNWNAYLERKKQDKLTVKELLSKKEEEIKELLATHGYDVKKIEIKARAK